MENNGGPHRQRKGVTPVQYGESLSSPSRPHSNRDGVSQPEQHYQTSAVDFESNHRGHRGTETHREEQIGYGRYRTERPGESNHPAPASCKRRLKEHSPNHRHWKHARVGVVE